MRTAVFEGVMPTDGRFSKYWKPLAAAIAILAVTTLSGCGTVQPTAVAAPVAATTTVISKLTVTAKPSTVTVTVQVTPTPTQPTGGPPQSLAIGAPVVLTTSDGEATITLNSAERKTEAGNQYADAPKLGNYIVMDVSYDATKGTASYNPYDWSVRDTDGHEYSPGSYDGYEPSLLSGDLTAGTKARGLVVIDAPAVALSAEYSAGSGAPATWLIP